MCALEVSKPNYFTRKIQTTVQWFHDASIYKRACIVSIIALPCIAIFALCVIHPFGKTAHAILISTDACLAGIFLLGMFIYFRTTRYYRRTVEDDYGYLSTRPVWYNWKSIDRTDEEIKGTFKWFLEMTHEPIRANGDQFEKVVNEQWIPLCRIPDNERPTSVHLCNQTAVIGFLSGQVHLIDYQNGVLISSFKGKGAIEDARVDDDQKQIVTISTSNCNKCFSARPKRKLEILQFQA